MKAGIRSIGLLLGILLLIVVFAPVPGDSRFVNTLHNAAHGPIFGCIALLILLGLRALHLPANAIVSRQYAMAFVLAVGAGLATEVAQSLTNRDASWMDLRNDAIGALAFLLMFFPFDARIRNDTMLDDESEDRSVGSVVTYFRSWGATIGPFPGCVLLAGKPFDPPPLRVVELDRTRNGTGEGDLQRLDHPVEIDVTGAQ